MKLAYVLASTRAQFWLVVFVITFVVSLMPGVPLAAQTALPPVSKERRELDSLERLLAAQRTPDTARANRLNRAAELLKRYFGDFSLRAKDTALSHLNEADTLAARLGYERGIAEAIVVRFSLLEMFTAAGNALLERAQGIFQRLGDKRWLAKTHLYSAEIVAKPIAELEQALALAREINDKELVSRIVQQIGYQQQIPAQRRVYFEQALALAKAIDNVREIVMCLLNIAYTYGKEGNGKRAVEVYKEAFATAKRSDVGFGNIPFILASLASAYASLGEYATALKVAEEATRNVEQMGDKSLAANIYWRVGDALRADYRGLPWAIELYSRLLALCEAITEEERHQGTEQSAFAQGKQNMAWTFYSIALAYTSLRQYDRALQAAQKAVVLQEECKDSSALCGALNQVGEIYRKQGLFFDSAVTYYHRARAVARLRRTRHDSLFCVAYEGNIGFVYCKQGRFQEGIALELRVQDVGEKAVAEGLFSNESLAEQFQNLGELYADAGQFGKALEYTRRAVEFWEKRGKRGNDLADCYRQLARVHEGLQQHVPALFAFKQYSMLHDSLFSAQNAEQTSVLQNTIESREREAQLVTLRAAGEQQALIRNAIIGGAGLLAMLLGGAVFGYWQRGRANTKILRQQRMLEAQAAQIQMTNTELQEVNTNLAEANTFKTKMLSIAAHDLKNPLGAITGFVYILQESIPAASEESTFVQHIGATAERMLKLVQDLLDTAAADMGKMEIAKQPMDMSSLVRETVAFYQPAATDKQQTITLTTPAECWINADWQRLRQVTDNLVSNAVKYAPHGTAIGVGVDVVNDAADDVEHPVLRLSVADEGPGLTLEDKTTVFGHFQRLSAQPTGGESSSGVGLAIVKQIVELHGGRVWVESTPEQGVRGATFIVELPM